MQVHAIELTTHHQEHHLFKSKDLATPLGQPINLLQHDQP